MNGGGPGACARSWITRAGGTTETIPSKVVTRLAPGDKLVIETAGAGGYGPPSERSQDALARDAADGKVSPEAAVRDYGIAVAKS